MSSNSLKIPSYYAWKKGIPLGIDIKYSSRTWWPLKGQKQNNFNFFRLEQPLCSQHFHYSSRLSHLTVQIGVCRGSVI